MVFHDRAIILAGGPVTAVASFRASGAERASAYAPHDTVGVIERVRRDAEGGDRHPLVEMFQLIFDPGIFGLHRIPTTFFVKRVREAVADGRLLIVPGWTPMGDHSPAGIRQNTSPQHHLVRRVMKDEQHLAFEGEKYLLVPAEGWTSVHRSGRHKVVPREKADDVLRRLAAHSAYSDRKGAIEEARSSLADIQTPSIRSRLFLLRHVERRVASAGSSTGPAATPSKLHRRDPHPATDMGQLVVRVRSPLGGAITGVAVDVPGLGVMSTGADGRANFGSLPAGTYQIRAKKTDHGPLPTGGGVFAVGEVTASQGVVAGVTSTAELQMTAVTSVKITHTPVVAATPLRIYKLSATDVHVDHLLTCTVLCARATGSGPGTQVPVRVEWTFTADAANAPKTKGGKDNTGIHFGAAAGHAMSGAGTSAATTVTDDSGQTQVLFRASMTSGDRFIVHAKVLRDAANPAAGDLGHDDSPKFEVWKRLDYRNLYRMQTGAHLGFDLASHCTTSNIQPAFTPTYTEYSVGAPTPVPYREYVTALVAPTAAQLPLNGTVQIRSDGADSRVVTVTGLVVAADGSTSLGTESVTLSGTSTVSGRRAFQKVIGVAVPPSADRTVTVETSAGVPVCVIGPHKVAAAPNFLFDTLAAVQKKAQSWYDANDAQLGVDMAALASSIGAPGYCMVGAAYYHPKMDGRPTTGRTTYYSGYPTFRLTYYSNAFHPDAKWGSVDGVNQDRMSCLFLNVSGGSYASMVARHEIGHASDHVEYGPGDHCPQKSCLMYAFSTNNQFCTKPKEHSVRRTMGWMP